MQPKRASGQTNVLLLAGRLRIRALVVGRARHRQSGTINEIDRTPRQSHSGKALSLTRWPTVLKSVSTSNTGKGARASQ
ncbi:hypothetical protein [Granulosicoccus antarcticus]|uniref:hypothetical protein n=1 Tax=Granulosicoccus antarcticus TaxID=437505 RepID=UPI000B5A5ACC|nr:hypothetical protein [Granulosicoccus antarcticus]